jgi:protoporphyrinogen oxidase
LPEKEEVIIIGAGPAGLTAAYALVKRGVRPLLLEKAATIGGLARTETYRGYRFDIGGHRFFTKNEQIERLWKHILGKDFLKVSRLSRIHFDNRYINYPLNFFNVLSNLGFIEGALILMSYLKTRIHFRSEETNFEQWATARFGKRLYEKFFKSYTEKVWGIPCHQIRSDWAAQRIRGLSLTSVLTKAILGKSVSKSLISEFHYPALGPGMMWQRLQKMVEDQGGRFRVNSEVVHIQRRGTCIESVTIREGEQKTEIAGRHFISSMPLTALFACIHPQPDDAVIKATMMLTYRAFILVGLIIDRKHLFPDQWIYIHSPQVQVGRIQNFKNWSHAMVPDPEMTSLGMEYFCSEGSALWNMTDTELVHFASRELSVLGLAHPDDVITGFVTRQPNAYPVYDHAYDSTIKTPREFLQSIKNLQTIGRNGLHRYSNMDFAMLTGLIAAQNILGENHDLWELNEAEDYFKNREAAESEQIHAEKILARTFAKMDRFAFGVALGTVSGLLFFLATVWLVIKGGEVVGPNLQLLSQYFFGYTVTVRGAFIAFGYGFLWGALFGWLFAGLRNLLFAAYIYQVKKRSDRLSL